MTDALVSKRLHVAGLTSAITSKDLQDCFSTFGQVTAVDGVGLLDGNGIPRKFAYVSIESSPAKLARCMNLLSGSVWKGAKLRVGEAKPNWEKRHEKELAGQREQALEDDALPRKKRRLEREIEGREASDLTPISLATAHEHKYWRLSTLNHIYRPMRMRPLHPLPPLPQQAPSTSVSSSKPSGKTKKPRVRELPKVTRARHVVIDPTKWGSVHVTGALLEASSTILPSSSLISPESTVKKKDKRTKASKAAEPAAVATVPTDDNRSPSLETSVSIPIVREALQEDGIHETFESEKTAGLELLKRMFGEDLDGADEFIDREDDDEVGVGDPLEAITAEDSEKDKAADEDPSDDEQEEITEDEGADPPAEPAMASEEDEDSMSQGVGRPAPKSAVGAVAGTEPGYAAPLTKPPNESEEILKKLFAPREDTGGFAFDLDLDDLDEDPSLLPSVPQVASLPEAAVIRVADVAQKEALPGLPFFFPTFEADGTSVERHAGIGGPRRGHPKAFWDVARDKGWTDLSDWPRESEEEARARWETVRGDLTRNWKKRAREARRRKRGTGLVEGLV